MNVEHISNCWLQALPIGNNVGRGAGKWKSKRTFWSYGTCIVTRGSLPHRICPRAPRGDAKKLGLPSLEHQFLREHYGGDGQVAHRYGAQPP